MLHAAEAQLELFVLFRIESYRQECCQYGFFFGIYVSIMNSIHCFAVGVSYEHEISSSVHSGLAQADRVSHVLAAAALSIFVI